MTSLLCLPADWRARALLRLRGASLFPLPASRRWPPFDCVKASQRCERIPTISMSQEDRLQNRRLLATFFPEIYGNPLSLDGIGISHTDQTTSFDTWAIGSDDMTSQQAWISQSGNNRAPHAYGSDVPSQDLRHHRFSGHQQEPPFQSQPMSQHARQSNTAPPPITYQPNSSRRVNTPDSFITSASSNPSPLPSRNSAGTRQHLLNAQHLKQNIPNGLPRTEQAVDDSMDHAFVDHTGYLLQTTGHSTAPKSQLSSHPPRAPARLTHAPVPRQPTGMATSQQQFRRPAVNDPVQYAGYPNPPFSNSEAMRQAWLARSRNHYQQAWLANAQVQALQNAQEPPREHLGSMGTQPRSTAISAEHPSLQDTQLSRHQSSASSKQPASVSHTFRPSAPQPRPPKEYNDSSQREYASMKSTQLNTANPYSSLGKRPRLGSPKENLHASKRVQSTDATLQANEDTRTSEKTSSLAEPSKTSENKYQLNPAAQKLHLSLRYRVEEFRLSDAAQVAEYDPTTIARDILLVADRYPTEPGLNKHLLPLRKNIAGLRADLDKVPWDFIDSSARRVAIDASHRPRSPRPDLASSSQPPQPSRPSKPSQIPQQPQLQPQPAASAPAPLPEPAPEPVPAPLPASTSEPVPEPVPASVPEPVLQGQAPLVPSHSINPSPAPASIDVSTLPSAETQLPSHSPHQSLSSHSSSPSPPSPARVARAQKQQAASTQSTPPPRAHLRASPKSSGSTRSPVPQVVIETPPTMVKKRAAGRPKKVNKPEESQSETPTQYAVFRCGIKGCEAELHNLAFLQSHCLRMHIPHHLTCQWEGCDDQTPRPAAAMWEHTRKIHIKPIAWELGDGPAVPSPGEPRNLHTQVQQSMPNSHL